MLIGPFGGMVEVADPESGASVPLSRPESGTELLSGGFVPQRAQRARRSWEVSWPWLPNEDVAALSNLEAGVLGGPLWFYDQVAAAEQMLPVSSALPGALGDWSALGGAPLAPYLDVAAGDGLTVKGGFRFTSSGSVDFPRRGGSAFPVPVVPGTTYTASALAVFATLTVSLRWVDADGVVLSTTAGSAWPTGTRASVLGVAPAGAAGVMVRLTVPTAMFVVSALQLSEGVTLPPWTVGQGGIPKVSMSGFGQTYHRVGRNAARSLSGTLTEVVR